MPFDLRSYRVISYNTHFAAIRSARQDLVAAAKGALDGSVSFSSPVSDYVPAEPSPLSTMIRAAADAEETGAELGFLDYRVRLEEGFGAMAAVLNEITQRTQAIDAETTSLTDRLPEVAGDTSAGSAKRARDLVGRYGDSLREYARAIEQSVTTYNARLQEVEGSLEYVVGAQTPSTEAEREQLRELLQVLEGTEAQAMAGRASYAGLADVMARLPKLESRFDRARKEAMSQLLSLVESIDRTITMISRAQAIGARILRTSEPGPGSGSPTT